MARWACHKGLDRCHQPTTERVSRNPTCTLHRAGQGRVLRPWSSSKAGFPPRSNEWPAISTPTSPSGFSPALLTTRRHLKVSQVWTTKPRVGR